MVWCVVEGEVWRGKRDSVEGGGRDSVEVWEERWYGGV